MAHSAKYTLGLTTIQFSAIASDGGVGTSFSTLGQTYENTCVLATDDPETTEFFIEESDTPVVSSSKEGKTTLKFSVADPDIDTLTELLGGTVTGVSPNRVWKAPATLPTVERSIKLTPKQGFANFTIARASISAKMNSTFSKKNLFLIEVTATVLTPTKALEAKLTIAE
jgi:hypothetical protein